MGFSSPPISPAGPLPTKSPLFMKEQLLLKEVHISMENGGYFDRVLAFTLP